MLLFGTGLFNICFGTGRQGIEEMFGQIFIVVAK
jgi:hypothetical protein